MDPNQSVESIYVALSLADCMRDEEELFYVCVNLKGWLNRGGFVPTGFDSKESCLNWLAGIMRDCKARAFAS